MTTKRMAIAAVLSVSLAAPVLAAEDVTEHETYEKRSMKVETVVPMAPPAAVPAPTRAYEHHDESESTTVERHTAPPPPPAAIVKERTTKSVETEEKN